DRKSGLPPRGDHDRISRERTHSDENGREGGKEGDRDRGIRKHEDYHRYNKSGERSSSRYDDRGYSKHESRGKYRDGNDDYRRQPGGGSRYGRDKYEGERRYREDDGHGRSDRHKRDESDNRKRSPDTGKHRREDGGHRETSKHRERRQRDDR
ncbi:Os06g0670500, partial [Oryza sativa Japonica Group]